MMYDPPEVKEPDPHNASEIMLYVTHADTQEPIHTYDAERCMHEMSF